MGICCTSETNFCGKCGSSFTKFFFYVTSQEYRGAIAQMNMKK